MHGLFTRSWALDRDNGDLGTEMGTQKLNKVPMGTWSPKLGPMWPQCIWVLWGISGYSEVLLSTLRYFLVPSNTVNDQIRNAHVKNAHAWPSSPSMWSNLYKTFCLTKSYISSAVLYLHLRCSCLHICILNIEPLPLSDPIIFQLPCLLGIEGCYWRPITTPA